MKNRCCLLPAMFMLMVGCAPGCHEKRPALGEEAPGYSETKRWYQNPETEEERAMRIWRLDSGR